MASEGTGDRWAHAQAQARILDAMAEADAVLAKDDRANALLAVAYQGLTALVER